MRFLRPRANLTLIAAVLVLQAASFAGTQSPVTDISKIKEADWSGLSEAQKKIALKVMNGNGCNCRCTLSIAACRASDENCRRSLIFSRTIIDALREGKPEAAGIVYKIDTGHNPLRGPKDAPVTIVEFSDFQCPYCAGLQSTLDQVLKAFPKEVNLVYKQFP